MIKHMVRAGEQRGNINGMMHKIADFYDVEINNTVAALTYLIEPLLIVFLGVVIVVIVMAMFLPPTFFCCRQIINRLRLLGMDKIEQRYLSWAVSATKTDLHNIVADLPLGIFPGSFCKINEDFSTGDDNKCVVIHSDGSGTKSIIAYLLYKETGNAAVFRSIAQDSIVMNIDDLLCVGIGQ